MGASQIFPTKVTLMMGAPTLLSASAHSSSSLADKNVGAPEKSEMRPFII
jgi:hypothetical protein